MDDSHKVPRRTLVLGKGIDASIAGAPVESKAKEKEEEYAPPPNVVYRPITDNPEVVTNLKGKAVFDYEGVDEDELTFSRGDEITIFEQCEDGWWTGELKGKFGVFPYNYVTITNGEVVEKTTNDKAEKKSSPQSVGKDGIIKAGYLTKKGHRRRNWTVRYFVLKENKLSYYSTLSEPLGKAKGTIELRPTCTIGPAAGMKRTHSFQITTCIKPYIYFVSAKDENEMQDWIDALKIAKDYTK
eukprot:TRINITY_DN19168_c0_g1_i1.p1 TRINITY_DN19168_c0_g1~~TRINITY_DN19168_c0_g1_i1.p1  ORF type:complete len:242 (+),score=58.31 TRINITY_DN19168_c0_g1_i1:80-805(+)